MAEAKFTITVNKDATSLFWNSPPKQAPLSAIRDLLSTPDIRDDKDGLCFIPGEFQGNRRSANAMMSIDMLVYDVDGHQTLQEALEKLTAAGVYALVYTTFSHRTNRTLIHTNHYDEWAKKNGLPSAATKENVLKYLDAKKKGHLKNVEFDPSDPKCREFNAKGLHIVVHHDPLDKFRVVLPLASPIPVATLSYTTKQSIAEWKSIYHGVGQALGLAYDPACEDPSRVHYMPACSKSNEDKFDVFQLGDPNDPVLLDWTKYPRVKTADKKAERGEVRRAPRDATTVTDKNGVPIDLVAWERDHANFDIETCLETHLAGEDLKDPRAKGGFHITCPNEADHSEPGGLGCFAANGDEEFGWTINCRHAGCAGRNRLDHLRALVEQGVLTAADIGIEKSPPTLNDALLELGLDPTTLALPNKEHLDVHNVVYTAEDGDDGLAADDVYQSALQEVLAANTAVQAAKAIGRIILKKCEYDLEEILEVLAKSAVSGEGISTLLVKVAKTLPFDVKNARTEVSSLRNKFFPLAERLEELSSSRATGHELEIQKAKIADFYLMDKRAITDEYNIREMELVKQRHGDIFYQRFPKLTAKWAKLRQGNRMVFLDMPESLKRGNVVTQRPSDLETWMRNENKTDIITVGKTSKEVKTFLYKTWVEECTEIKEFFGVTFIPNGPRVTPDNKYNIWSGDFFIPRIQGDCSLVTNHIRDVWCNGDIATYNWVMTWLACIFQKPDYKPPTALVLLGAQGTGKSIIFEHGIAKILGPYFDTSADREDVVGRFSGHLVGKLLWVAEESLFAGDKRAMNKLKSRISSATVDVEYKGLDKFSIPSFTRFVFTSNQIHALNLESDDRRFCVLPTNPMYHQDIEYFTRMREWLDADGASILFDFLMTWRPEDVGLTWKSLMSPPYNEAKRQQAEMSLEPADTFFLDILKYGRIIDAPSSIFTEGTVTWPLNEPSYIKGDTIRAAYEAYLKFHMGNTARFDRTKFAALASRYLCEGQNFSDMNKTRRVEGVTIRAIAMPPRKEFLEGAARRRHITEADLAYALDNPDSHLYNEPASDVI